MSIYLPSMAYTPFSIRGAGASGGVDYTYATSWSFPPYEMITFLLPSGVGFGGATYWGGMPFTDYPNYMGAVLLFLAVFAVCVRRDLISRFLAGTALGALALLRHRHPRRFEDRLD